MFDFELPGAFFGGLRGGNVRFGGAVGALFAEGKLLPLFGKVRLGKPEGFTGAFGGSDRKLVFFWFTAPGGDGGSLDPIWGRGGGRLPVAAFGATGGFGGCDENVCAGLFHEPDEP